VDSHAVWDVTEDIHHQLGHISNQKVYQPEIYIKIPPIVKLTQWLHVTTTSVENTDHAQLLDQPQNVNPNVTTVWIIAKTNQPTKDHQSTEFHQDKMLSKPN